MGRFFSWIGELIKSCVDGIIGFFASLWGIFWDLLCKLGAWFLDWFLYVWEWVEYGYYCALDWILKQFLNFLSLIDDHVSIDIDDYLDAVSSFAPYIQAVNAFMPLDVILVCCAIYLTCLVTWCIYKFVKSWIPAVSGS